MNPFARKGRAMNPKISGVKTSLAAVLFVTAGAGVSSAAEVCATSGAAQFVDGMRYCVSSALPPQGRNSYTPDNLFDGNPATAWCEGVRGDGSGESVTITIQGGSAFRRLIVHNGYGKSQAAYFNNSRPRTVEIATDTGERFQEILPDSPSGYYLMLPAPAEYRQIRLTVLDVYTGRKYADTCLGDILPDFEYEELLLQREQSDQPATPPSAVTPGESGGILDELPSLEKF